MGQIDSTRAHSSCVSSDRDQPPRRVTTPQDLSVTKQHRNDRWDRCTASAGDWQIITTTSHRSANQRYFMHNSATVHRMRMQSSALDSSRSQLCSDTSTGVVRHQITKWRRLQNVVSYRVLHHSCGRQLLPMKLAVWRAHGVRSPVTTLLPWSTHSRRRSTREIVSFSQPAPAAV